MTMHGGDIWQAAEDCNVPALEILDFSANVNPRGLPPRAMERLQHDASDARLLRAYPDPSARRLRRALSERFGIPAESIVIGPGAESLLYPIFSALLPRRALVPVPAFSEYKRVCSQQNAEYATFRLSRAACFRLSVGCLRRFLDKSPCGLVLLNNPHNPSGAMLDAGELQGAFSRKTLLVDEAFINYVPQASLVRKAADRLGLVVLRSLTKFYGCPALRVGYAVAHPEIARTVQALLPAWPVTQLAIEALAEAVRDQEFAEASIRENAIERERLSGSLNGLGLFVFPSAANYLLLELQDGAPAAAELQRRLLQRHRILVRNCDSYEGLAPGRYVRVAVRSSADNCRLVCALEEELQ